MVPRPLHRSFEGHEAGNYFRIFCLQPASLSLESFYCSLLFFDCIEHGPQDGIVVNQQVALVICAHCFGNDLLHGLRPKPDVLSTRFKAQRVVGLIFIAQRL